MDKFEMRVQVENGECLPQPTFVADSCGFADRSEMMAHYREKELMMTVSELQACLEDNVIDQNERIVVPYSKAELMEMLRDSATLFLWQNMPDALRRTFATRNVLPLSRKMKPLEQALLVIRHLKKSSHKKAEWLHWIERYLMLTVTNNGSNLKDLVMNGAYAELESYAESEVRYADHALVPKVVATGYLLASFAAFLDRDRSLFWMETVHRDMDPDWRYLEQILHAVPMTTFFYGGSVMKAPEKVDLQERIRSLEMALREERQQHSQEITELMNIINALNRRDVESTAREQIDTLSALQGRKIAVVGDDTRQPVYRLLLERTGATAIFAPGFSKLRQSSDEIAHADGVIFMTASSSHALYYALKAKRHFSTVVLVNQCGIRSFEEGLVQLSGKLGVLNGAAGS